MWIILSPLLALAAPPSAPDALSLTEAVELCLEHHEDARIAEWRYHQQAARRRQVLSRLLPHANLGGSLVYRPESSFTAVGVGTVDTGSRTIWTGRASLSTNLVDLGAIPDLLRAGRALDAQKLATSEARRMLAFAVSEQFLIALATEQVRVAAIKRVEVADATVGEAEVRRSAGAGRPSDVTRAQLEQSSARLSVVEAARNVDLARITLGDLLGDGNGARARGSLVAPDASLLTLEEGPDQLGPRARRERNDLRQARLAVEAARYAVWENLAGYLPRITASADVTKQDDGFVDRELEWTVALGLSWSLYEGGWRLAEDSYREASAEIAALEEARLGRTVETELSKAVRRLDASLEELSEAELQAQLARRNLEETGAMFQHGLVTALERVDAIARSFEADAELARRQLESRLAELLVLRAVGAWPVDLEESAP